MTATMLESDSSGTPSRALAEHRPHLDGLRAVAVYLVVLYHAGLSTFAGGFIGVDVFFVLSGYLVTQVLLRDFADHGRIRLRRFYARRYRRLLPAAFVVLMITAAVLTVVGTAADASGAEGGFRASFLYVANWHFVSQAADYFADDVNSNPVLHFWSLAVEEQFYLAWPVLLGSLHLVTRRARHGLRWIRWTVATAALVSAIAALQLASTGLARAYYGTDTRAFQLLAGAFLALTPSLATRTSGLVRTAQGLAAAALVAIVALAIGLRSLDAIERGVAVTIITAALLVAVEGSSTSGWVARALSHPVVAYLGRVSYGTYLWHWPLIVLLGMHVTLSPGWLAVVACLAATGLAIVSFHALERPVRISKVLDLRPAPVIAAGLALSVVSGLFLAPAVLATAEDTSIDLDWRAAQDDNPPRPECTHDTLEQCTVVRGSGPHLLLIGDSNARMYIPAFTEIARREGLTLSVAVTPVCPWARGLFYQKDMVPCHDSKVFWYDELIGALDPDVVVFGQRPMDDPASPVGVFAHPTGRFDYGSPGYDAALEDLTRQTVSDLRADGRLVVIIEPIPIARKEDDPLRCLSSASDVDACSYKANMTPTPLETVYRSLHDGSGTWSLDLDELVCPRLPTCDAVVDGLIVKRDFNHITGTYSAYISAAVAEMIDVDGMRAR